MYKRQVNIHVKIDTGMSRLGFYYQDISRDEATVQEVKAACQLPGLHPEGIFTHFAVSDEGKMCIRDSITSPR